MQSMQLSKRLLAVAQMVTGGSRLADVGTDHGYIPIYLVRQERIPQAIAMDVNRGPLKRAQENISMYAAEQYIETRLSDGVSELRPGEVDCVVIAGMGGNLVIKILTDGEGTIKEVKELVLQPQSDIARVRHFLQDSGFRIVEEDFVSEDGKDYPMIKAVHGKMEDQLEIHFLYGRYLLEHKHPVLFAFLKRQQTVLQQIQQRILASGSAGSRTRIEEIEQEMRNIDCALKYYEM